MHTAQRRSRGCCAKQAPRSEQERNVPMGSSPRGNSDQPRQGHTPDRPSPLAGEGHVRCPSQALFFRTPGSASAAPHDAAVPGRSATRLQDEGTAEIRQGAQCKILREKRVTALDEVAVSTCSALRNFPRASVPKSLQHNPLGCSLGPAWRALHLGRFLILWLGKKMVREAL